MSINQIENKIKTCKRGKIFFLDDFAGLGTPEAIKKSLQRLTNSGLLVRLANGIYWYPKKEIVPTGLHALNLLNLSTQVPANVVYLTDGTARKISIGEGNRNLKQI